MFFLTNQAVGADFPLGVQPVRVQSGPQVLELAPRVPEAPFAQLWDLIADVSGEYRLQNWRGPNNYLSVALEGRGAPTFLPAEPLPDSTGDALLWSLRRAGDRAAGGRFDEAWFELTPVKEGYDSVALTASPQTRELSLEPRVANPPATMLWAFEEYEDCSR